MMKFVRPVDVDVVEINRKANEIIDLMNNTDFGISKNMLSKGRKLITLIPNVHRIQAVGVNGVNNTGEFLVLAKKECCRGLDGFLDHCCLAVKTEVQDSILYTMQWKYMVYVMGFLSNYTSVYAIKTEHKDYAHNRKDTTHMDP